MRPFRYARAADPADAVAAAGASGVAYLGGGTTLVDLMKLGVMAPSTLVDVSRLRSTRGRDGAKDVLRDVSKDVSMPEPVTETSEGLTILAAARNSDVAVHGAVRSRYPALSEALLSGASPQIRNMATVAGNLLQRTRCAYFRDVGVAACNKRSPGSECAAQSEGAWSRMHAILGGSDACIAVHPSDLCVALVALDAVVHTLGRKGPRTILINDLHALPEEHPEVENILEPGELVTHVTVPASPRALRSRYVKVRDRSAFAFALASAAVALELTRPGGGGRIRSARVALGGVATKPWHALQVENALIDRPPTRAVFEQAAAQAVPGARTTPQNAFKVALMQRTIVRALERAAGVEA